MIIRKKCVIIWLKVGKDNKHTNAEEGSERAFLISLGILDTILIVRTMEIPFPMPFSVIRSPSHISIAEPAVKLATTTIPFRKFMFGRHWSYRNRFG